MVGIGWGNEIGMALMDWLIGVINGGSHCLDGVNGLLGWWRILLHLLLVLSLLVG